MSTSYEERRWKLGQGMCSDENILDPVSFDDLIRDLKCSYDHPSYEDVRAQAQEILDQRIETYWDLIENNLDEILEAVDDES